MKTQRRRFQSGHGMVEHVIQFALMAGIIVAIIYACGGGGEEEAPVYNPPPVAQNVSRSPRIAQPMVVNPGAPTPVSPTVLASRSNPRLVQQTDLQPAQPVRSVESVSTPVQAQDRAQNQNQNPNSRLTRVQVPAERISARPDLRVTQRQAEVEADKIGRIIIIVVIIALAVIVFWFVHANMMYKRTLRVVTTAQVASEGATAAPDPNAPEKKEPLPETLQPVEESPPPADAHASHPKEHAEPDHPPAQDSPFERLSKLKAMLDKGLISQDDFEGKKKDILDNI